MAKLELEVVRDDTPSVTCEYDSLNEMMKDAYRLTILRKARAYHILYNQKVVGGCMVKFVLTGIEDDAYSDGEELEFPACEISYVVIEQAMRGHHIGSYVLELLIREISAWAEQIPIRFLTIEAFEGLQTWYRQLGFREYKKVGKKQSAYFHTVSMCMDFANHEELKQYEESF